ncbi:MAG: hypothetical protein CM15mP3_03120 [Candidatus Poseidoniales archaeon]|nr:MAG: hypothetical protein CM15mP3_03120 [Candidatus Poseidoniales archaeon]
MSNLQQHLITVYPIETTYTIGEIVEVTNIGPNGALYEELMIPRDVATIYGQTTMFDYTDVLMLCRLNDSRNNFHHSNRERGGIQHPIARRAGKNA